MEARPYRDADTPVSPSPFHKIFNLDITSFMSRYSGTANTPRAPRKLLWLLNIAISRQRGDKPDARKPQRESTNGGGSPCSCMACARDGTGESETFATLRI